ncbi:Transcriptional regulator [Vibrio chagasii]|uniref:LysR family transcriptional regulator n=1 Tax=Vibrio TaxID=662 RepID=UPI00076ABF7E|nr:MULTISPECIES: LysR family transcriptional regulator [Vibrio]MCG9560843.1 LysR family transcriptional regulator [Vibrio chagasii]MCG9672331.1 LysR family transcriptional regulator [Vibrio chagasii]NOI87396.1 LysR family transcriptional regulator [Vibrio sp. 99K-1]CAH6848700.1 Transcriptional regulator [Vibrio chagasii]CAH6848749.1 Transcriptional regulator [Vibrio chagasii]
MDSFEGINEFVAVAECHGFSAAAKQLGCSTSHVSRQVSRLEERVGVALLARSTRMVSLTESGHTYYQQCKDLVIGLQQANEQVTSQQTQLSGTLRVSAAGAFAENHVAAALMEFAKSHPDLTIEMNFNTKMVNFIEDGIDFAIRYGRLDDSGLVARKLVDRPMAAAASKAYIDQYGAPAHPEQLKQHSCIIANSDQWLFEQNGKPLNAVRVHGRWRSNNSSAVLKACEEGLGVVYLPRSSFNGALSNGKLVPVLEEYWGSGTSSWIVYQNRRFLPQRARLAIDFLVDYFSGWDE